jgi:hypothetical protein
MRRSELATLRADDPFFSQILDNTPIPRRRGPQSESLFYVMGPYTAFDASYPFEDPPQQYIDPGLFDPERDASFEETLATFCGTLRDEHGVWAFIATDLNVPTESEAEGTSGLSPLDQSILAATYADSVFFVVDEAGLNAGVGSEIGAVLSEFQLRLRTPQSGRKPRQRLQICLSDSLSASIEEVPYTYGVDVYEYDDWADLVTFAGNHIQEIWAKSRDPSEDFPVYTDRDGTDYYASFHTP